MKSLAISALGLVSVLYVFSLSAIAAAGDKITGGADSVLAGGISISLTANAVVTGNGSIKGHIQYSREAQTSAVELYVHAVAECMWISADGTSAVVAGPATVQSNPNGAPTADWFVIAIREGGTGAGDEVRAIFATEADGLLKCQNGETSFPGEVLEGNFTLRKAL